MAKRSLPRARRAQSLPSPVGPELADIIQRLETARATVATAASALTGQAADIDTDVARLLRAHVCAELSTAIERLKAVRS